MGYYYVPNADDLLLAGFTITHCSKLKFRAALCRNLAVASFNPDQQ
jgi:hypothetical protein